MKKNGVNIIRLLVSHASWLEITKCMQLNKIKLVKNVVFVVFAAKAARIVMTQRSFEL